MLPPWFPFPNLFPRKTAAVKGGAGFMYSWVPQKMGYAPNLGPLMNKRETYLPDTGLQPNTPPLPWPLPVTQNNQIKHGMTVFLRSVSPSNDDNPLHWANAPYDNTPNYPRALPPAGRMATKGKQEFK